MAICNAQSWSVWSLGRYLIPRLSSSASTSSGTRPLTRTAYMPRTYLAGWKISDDLTGPRDALDVHVLCQRATQLDSGSMAAMIPSKYVVVQTAIRSGEPFICQGNSWVDVIKSISIRTCMISSQFGQPFFLKSMGCWIIEQSRQALSCFDFACEGIAAMALLFVERRGCRASISANGLLSIT